MKIHFFISLISILVCVVTSFLCVGATDNTHYYKCTSHRGTVFSQFPCDSNATQHKIEKTNVAVSDPNMNYVKALNEIERERIIRDIKADIRSKKYKLDILSRERDRAEFAQQQRLTRMMSESDAKHITKDISKQLKVINKQYARDVKKVKKQIAKLEKSLEHYE